MADKRLWVGLAFCLGCARSGEVLTSTQALEPQPEAAHPAEPDAGPASEPDVPLEPAGALEPDSTPEPAEGGNGAGQPDAAEPMVPAEPESEGPAREWGRSLDDVMLGMGEQHVVIQARSGIWGWGSNASGELGLPEADVLFQPHQVVAEQYVTQLSGGGAHTCGLSDGQVYCVGDNSRGQLGVGHRDQLQELVSVVLPSAAIQISAGDKHTCAILDDQTLWCWGANPEGQLGIDAPYAEGLSSDVLAPEPVEGNWLYVSSGQGHSCGIDADRRLFCWGRNSQLQLGGGKEEQVRRPSLVTDNADWLQVAAGQAHTCGIRNPGTLWCWGTNAGSDDASYPLGLPDATVVEYPAQLDGNEDWAQVATSVFHTCGLKAAGELFCWGRNQEGQLGIGQVPSVQSPVWTRSDVRTVGVSRFATCVVDLDGRLACTGDNRQGATGEVSEVERIFEWAVVRESWPETAGY